MLTNRRGMISIMVFEMVEVMKYIRADRKGEEDLYEPAVEI